MPDRDEERRRRVFEELAATGSAEARRWLIESYGPLAEYFANRYKNRTDDHEDLRQVAHLALVKAVDRFDPERGVGFSTYAGRTIDGELKRHFRDRSWVVRVPRSLQEAALAVRAAVDELTMATGTAPTVDQLVERTGLDADLVLQALDVRSAMHAESIDRPTGDGEGGVTTSAMLGTTDRNLERAEVSMAMRSAIETLPERERTIVELRFYGELTQQQIADRLGISQMHVSRLLRGALVSLRAHLR